MRSFKKALMAFAAVTAVSAAFAATSFAADLAASYDKDNGKVTVTAGLEEASGQMTVLLIAKGADADGITEDEILYINQAAANGNATFGDMGVLGGELADGEYTLKVGSDADGFTLLSFDFTVGGNTVKVGDVTCDGLLLGDDLTALTRHFAQLDILETGTAAWKNADTTQDGSLLGNDLTKLTRYFAQIITAEELATPGE